jgi:hypothetical protein
MVYWWFGIPDPKKEVSILRALFSGGFQGKQNQYRKNAG